MGHELLPSTEFSFNLEVDSISKIGGEPYVKTRRTRRL